MPPNPVKPPDPGERTSRDGRAGTVQAARGGPSSDILNAGAVRWVIKRKVWCGMPLLRRALSAMLITLAMAWAACLTLLGIHALTVFRDETNHSVLSVVLWLSVFFITSGNFVFMELVADRLIRIRRRIVLDAVELIVAAAMIVSVGMFVSLWLTARTIQG